MSDLIEEVLKEYEGKLNNIEEFDFALISYAVEKIAVHLIECNIKEEYINIPKFERRIIRSFQKIKLEESDIYLHIKSFYEKYGLQVEYIKYNPIPCLSVKKFKVNRRNLIINDVLK